MTCEQRRDLFLLYVAHALEPGEREELRRHLATGCLACAAALAAARAAFDLLALAPTPVAPRAEAWQRLQDRIDLGHGQVHGARGHLDILARGHVAKYLGHLEGAVDAQVRAPVHGQAVDLVAQEIDLALIGFDDIDFAIHIRLG